MSIITKMKTKGAKRRSIPKHYFDTLNAINQCNTMKDVYNKLFITSQGLHVRIGYMNKWFGEVAIPNEPGNIFQKPKLSARGQQLLILHNLGLSDEEILERMEIK